MWLTLPLLLNMLLAAPDAVGSGAEGGAPTTTVVAASSGPQPATVPVQITLTTEAESGADAPVQPAPDAGRIELSKLVSGEQMLTLEQLARLGPWVQIATDLALTVLGFIPRLLVAMLLFFIFWLIYRGVRRIVIGGMNRASVDPSIRDMLVSMLKWAILGFALVIAGNQIGIQIAALLTGVSIIGLAIGFAAQETLANFIAGVVIFWDKPFKIGDWIEIEGVFGQVKRVTFRSTRILNLDGEVVVFPNTAMLSSKLSNHSTNPINRVSIPIGIAYKESIDAARDVLLGLTAGDERLCAEPKPEVVVSECADSSVNLLLRFWILDEAIERRIGYEYLERAKEALDAAGIQIPYPHMQLFVESTAAVDALAGNGRAGAHLHPSGS